MTIKFKTDEYLPDTAAALLRQAGYDVSTIIEEELGGGADPRVMTVCQAEERVLLTLDRRLGDVRAYPPARTHGIVVLRPREQDVDGVLGLVQRLINVLENQSPAHTLWIVDERRIRIRR